MFSYLLMSFFLADPMIFPSIFGSEHCIRMYLSSFLYIYPMFHSFLFLLFRFSNFYWSLFKFIDPFFLSSILSFFFMAFLCYKFSILKIVSVTLVRFLKFYFNVISSHLIVHGFSRLLTSLSEKSNKWVTLSLVSVHHLFSHESYLDFFLVLHALSHFLLNSWHCKYYISWDSWSC